MNASLPPEDERREERKEEVRQDVPNQAAPGIRLGTNLGLLVAVVIVVFLMLPMLQHERVPAQRSTHAEMERRQQAIEQAAREASDEDAPWTRGQSLNSLQSHAGPVFAERSAGSSAGSPCLASCACSTC